MAGETVLNNRYQLMAQQGSGGMAVIYKAIDRLLGRTVAVKILRPSLTHDPSFLAGFRNEARSVANLSHPNIVTVLRRGQRWSDALYRDGIRRWAGPEEDYQGGSRCRLTGRLNWHSDLRRARLCPSRGSGPCRCEAAESSCVTRDDVVKVTDFGIAQALSDTQPQQRSEWCGAARITSRRSRHAAKSRRPPRMCIRLVLSCSRC